MAPTRPSRSQLQPRPCRWLSCSTQRSKLQLPRGHRSRLPHRLTPPHRGTQPRARGSKYDLNPSSWARAVPVLRLRLAVCCHSAARMTGIDLASLKVVSVPVTAGESSCSPQSSVGSCTRGARFAQLWHRRCTINATCRRPRGELDVPDIGYQSQTPSPQPILATAAADEACRGVARPAPSLDVRARADRTARSALRCPAGCWILACQSLDGRNPGPLGRLQSVHRRSRPRAARSSCALEPEPPPTCALEPEPPPTCAPARTTSPCGCPRQSGTPAVTHDSGCRASSVHRPVQLGTGANGSSTGRHAELQRNSRPNFDGACIRRAGPGGGGARSYDS